MNEPLLTSKQVAELLAISVKSVVALVNSGDLAFVAIGQGKVHPRMRFERRDVEDYIKRAKRVRPAPSCAPPGVRRRLAAADLQHPANFVDFDALRKQVAEQKKPRRSEIVREKR